MKTKDFTEESVYEELLDYAINRNFPEELFDVGSKVYIENICDTHIQSVEKVDGEFVVTGQTTVETVTDLGEGDSAGGDYPLHFTLVFDDEGKIVKAKRWKLDNSSFFE